MKQKLSQNSKKSEIDALNKSIKELLAYGQSNSILDIILLISKSRSESFEIIKKKFIELIKLYKPEDIDEITKNAIDDESSQFILGMIYDEGLIGQKKDKDREQKKDKDRAKYWYKKSYESRYSPAEFILSEQKN
jgi:TPR repeat protein